MSTSKEAQQQQSKERKLLLGFEAVAVERHREAPNAEKVYPRACGETFFSGCSTCQRTGLSPRMRGNLRIGGVNPGTGSIPAHAGKPSFLKTAFVSLRVYPRACGETGKSITKDLNKRLKRSKGLVSS